MKVIRYVFAIFICLIALTLNAFSMKNEDPNSFGEENSETEFSESAFLESISENLEYTLKIMPFLIFQTPADSSQNPDNEFLEISSQIFETNLRLDVNLSLNYIDLAVKPRYIYRWKYYQSDVSADQKEEESYFHEYLVRLKFYDSMSLSYGRENLQWGPSNTVSPSNPFFKNNGRANPKEEIDGMEFIRFSFVPSIAWTLSLIANINEGRQEYVNDSFEKTYCWKIDYTGQDSYLSLILASKENDRDSLGGFAKLTVSDEVLIYGEMGLSQGTNALYPVEDTSSPFGISLEAIKEEDAYIAKMVLIGGAYTFDSRQTLTIELIYNADYGYSDEQTELYYQLRSKAASAYRDKGMLFDLSKAVLAQTSDTGLKLFNQYYSMIQYQQMDAWNLVDLTFRYTANFGDNSYQFLSLIEHLHGDNFEFYFIGLMHSKDSESEFGSILESQAIFGLTYYF